MFKGTLTILAVSALVVVGCKETPTEPSPLATLTQPPKTPTPTPITTSATVTPRSTATATATPTTTTTRTLTRTPELTPATNPLFIRVTLTRLVPPPGVKHAVLAEMVLTETQGRTLTLSNYNVGSFLDYEVMHGNIVVSGFTPRQLAPGQTTTYRLTLTTTTDIPCADGLWVGVLFQGGREFHSQTAYFDCSTGRWLF